MQTFYPGVAYIRYFGVALIVGILGYFLTHPHQWVILGFMLLIAIGGSVINMGAKITISENGELAYTIWGHKYQVNLNQLTDCKISFGIHGGQRSFPFWKTHLYDASGGYADFPTSIWLHKRQLNDRLRQAVENNHINVNPSTTKKLNLH